VGDLDNPNRQKRAPPRKNYIPPGIDGSKKTRGVFSIIRTKLVLANFDGGGGYFENAVSDVQNTVYVVAYVTYEYFRGCH
jgi:hypothetical protein